MRSRIFITTLMATFLSSCTSYEGNYSPACVAFEGSKIALSEGRFLWEKFTDQVFVNDDGEIVNSFPGYPMKGVFRIDGQSVHLKSDSGESLPSMFLHERNKRHYLLTAEQFAQLEISGTFPECALVLEARPTS
jgi:hypothetical protein